MTVPVTAYIALAGVLFTLGALTVLLRRNAIIELMGVELMLNAVNLVLVTFSRIHGDLSGQVFAFFVMVVAAAEVVVGLSIVVSIFRTRRPGSWGPDSPPRPPSPPPPVRRPWPGCSSPCPPSAPPSSWWPDAPATAGVTGWAC